jgi:hypothetical protein
MLPASGRFPVWLNLQPLVRCLLCIHLPWLILEPWRTRRNVSSKHLLSSSRVHCDISQKTILKCYKSRHTLTCYCELMQLHIAFRRTKIAVICLVLCFVEITGLPLLCWNCALSSVRYIRRVGGRLRLLHVNSSHYIKAESGTFRMLEWANQSVFGRSRFKISGRVWDRNRTFPILG